MRPKGKLAILVVLFAGVGVLAATAAFDTVEADRTAEVETAGDADALLGLEAGDTELAENTDDGLLQITLGEEIDDEGGLNQNATTSVLPDENTLFNVSNNGADDIDFDIQEFSADGDVDIYFITDATVDSTGGGNLDLSDVESEIFNEGDYDVIQTTEDDFPGNLVSPEISSGDNIDVGIVFDVDELDEGDDVFDGDITLEADGI